MKKTALISVAFSLLVASPSSAHFVTQSSASFAVSVGLAHPGPAPSAIEENIAVASPFLDASREERRTAALRLISSAGLDKNLSLLLLDQARKDSDVQAAIAAHGFQLVKTIVVDAIKQERREHRQDWVDVLTNVYADLFSAEQLNSIAVERDQSPYFTHLIEAQNQIATAVKEKGASTLAKAKLGVHARIISALGT